MSEVRRLSGAAGLSGAPGLTGAPGHAADGGRPVLLLLSGPNLDLLGERQPDVYGTATLEDHREAAAAEAATAGYALEHLQSNHEGDLVDAVHAARGRVAGIVINPAAFTHYAWSLHDALVAFDGPVVELHLSQPAGREAWRHTSVVAPVAAGSITGFGAHGYRLAVQAIVGVLASTRP